MYQSSLIVIRKSLATLVVAAAALTGAFGASAHMHAAPTHAAGDGFVWPMSAPTVDGSQ